MKSRPETDLAKPRPEASLGQKVWRLACGLLARTFYRRHEVAGLESLPAEGPVILCANHVNSLVDAVVVQSKCPRPIHPLARSGLFRHPLLRPLLQMLQAVPVYRHRPEHGATDPSRNEDSFERCFDYLGEGRVLLIFPEGQSHSDPMLRPLKTGAARLALGHLDRHGAPPVVVPVGLTFTEKGRFRSDVLVLYGKPVEYRPRQGEPREEAVKRYTAEIEDGLERVTLNVDSWDDLALLRLLQRFFLLRQGRGRHTLARRFRSLQRLIANHRWLRSTRPGEIRKLSKKLLRFEALCRRFGVRNYQLELDYRPAVVARFAARSLAFGLLVFPLTVWGFLNSALPYFLTRWTTRRAARARDQYDSAGMITGTINFLLFWGGQTFAVHWLLDTRYALAYAATLPFTTAVALQVGYQRKRIVQNVWAFFVFLRSKNLKGYLLEKRRELETELARLARLAKRGLAESS